MSYDLRQFETLLTRGSVVLVRWKAEEGWPIEHVTPNIRDILGFSAEEFLDGHVLYADLIHPDDLPKLQHAVRRAVDEGSEWCPHDDYRLRHKDGRWVWVQDDALVDRNEAGDVVGFAGSLLDISRLKDTEAALETQRDRLSLVLEGTRLGIWDWNPQTNEVTFDGRWAEMLGWRLDEIESTLESWKSRVHPDDLEECFADIAAHMEGRTPFYENVHRMKHRAGHWVHILDRGRVCEWDAEGQPVRFTGTHTDITAQREAEIAATEANAAKSNFLARMSHEIRTPLNGVLGVVQLLDRTDPTPMQREYLEVIHESGENLLTIVGDVLDMSKIEAGAMHLEPHSFDVKKMIRSVFELYRERAVSKGLDYELKIRPELYDTATGDSHRIRQVLGNMISNAIKFTDEGHVLLEVGNDTDFDSARIVFRISDTGPGISNPDDIWETFRQNDVSISRRFGGTGLGLAISRQLVELMGGRIDLETQLGKGSEFVVHVPVTDVSIGKPSHSMSRENPDEGEGCPRLDVLVAEDNSVNQLVIRRALEALGQSTTIVENGADAVEAIQKGEFDLVFMDLHMPVMNGIEAAKEIRRLGIGTKIVALSADALAVNSGTFDAADFACALTKPFRFEEIENVIRDAAECKA